MLEECTESCKELLDSKEVFIGSFKETLQIIFFKEKPNLKRYKGCEIYGSNIIIPITDGFLYANMISRENCFDIYHKGRISGMYAIMGYYDNWHYELPIIIISPSIYDDIISSKWIEVCESLNIKDLKMVRKHYKIIVPEFMYLLKDFL